MSIKLSLTTIYPLFFTLLITATASMGQRRCCAIDSRSSQHACEFNSGSFSYAGTPVEQARCLLRKVKTRGELGESQAHLPSPLEDLIGKPFAINPEAFRKYLSKNHIDESEIGGDLSKPLAPVDSSRPTEERARYFVIHDTSTPNYWNAIPSNINEATWSGNNLRRFDPTITHVYVNRLGQSLTVVDFQRVLPRTKFGTKFSCCLGEQHKGLFIHVELTQPRHCDPSKGRCLPYRRGSDIATHSSNDYLAPNPGFTRAQMDRLALIYVAASLRKHEWLIPSFHAPMDATLLNAHDDPQNFDLAEWANSLTRLLAEIAAP